MNAEILFIVICYVFIGFLLVLFNLRTTYHWIVKSSLIVVTMIFYIFTYNSFRDLVGWPTNEPLPDRFRLISAQIYEPNALIDSEGSIFLWITDMNDMAGLSTPRSYSLKYNKEIHERVSKALVSLKNGIPQMGENVDENKKNIIKTLFTIFLYLLNIYYFNITIKFTRCSTFL